MPIRKYNPTSPGHAVPDRADLRRDHDVGAAQAARRAAARVGRPQQPRRAHVVVARRRPQADVPHHRLQARQARHSRRRSSTIEYDPNRSARIALLTYADGEKRYILQPIGLKVGDTIVAGRERRHPAGQRAAAEEHPARHADPQRRAEAGQGRPDRAQRRIVGAAGRQGRRLRVGEDAVGRDPQDLHRVLRDDRPGRQPRSRERVDRQGRPQPLAGQAAARARRGDEPGRSPARRR